MKTAKFDAHLRFPWPCHLDTTGIVYEVGLAPSPRAPRSALRARRWANPRSAPRPALRAVRGPCRIANPSVGIIPGIILIVVIELIVTWSAFVLGTFKLNHRETYSLADVGRILGGRWGEEFFSAAVCICMLFFSASGMVGVSTALNAVSMHATCTAVWMVVIFVVSYVLASIRTLGNITWLAWPAFISILAAVLAMTIAIGLQDRPHDAPKAPLPWDKDFKLFVDASFAKAISAVATILFAAAGTPT